MLYHKLAFCLIIFFISTIYLSQAAFAQPAYGSRSLQDYILDYLIGLSGAASGGGAVFGAQRAGEKKKEDRAKEGNNGRKALDEALRALWSILPYTEEFTLSKELNHKEIENLWRKLQEYYYSENLSVLENSERKDLANEFLKFYSDIKSYLSEPNKMEKESTSIIQRIKQYHNMMDEKRKQFMAEVIQTR